MILPNMIVLTNSLQKKSPTAARKSRAHWTSLSQLRSDQIKKAFSPVGPKTSSSQPAQRCAVLHFVNYRSVSVNIKFWSIYFADQTGEEILKLDKSFTSNPKSQIELGFQRVQ
jgi:hypothetical protein